MTTTGHWLQWAGVTDVAAVFFRPNLAVADAEPWRQAALRAAREVAKCHPPAAEGPRSQ